jgi:small-conductance mechanosensitive channel
MKKPLAFSLQNFSSDLRDDFNNPGLLWQAGILVLCLLLAWQCARLLRKRILTRRQAQAEAQAGPSADAPPNYAFAARSLELGLEGLLRLAFPLFALVFVLIGQGLLERYPPVRSLHLDLLGVAASLLFAMAGIRAIVYLLRNVFPASNALKVGERWIGLVIWLAVATHLVGLTDDLIALFESVNFKVGKQTISLWLIGQGVFSVALTLLVSLWLSAVFEQRLMRADSLDMSFRVVLGRFAKALLVTVAVLVSLALVGIDLTVLSVFGGALGVGLGLGLQRIASNYMSGFIILLDHSIRIGDLVTVDKFSGAVTHIATRYTVLKGLDGTESILPNEMFVSSPVVNHSFTNRKVAVTLPLAVAYDSDLPVVQELMLNAARNHPRVLADPPPRVALARFGADGLELEMGFWIEDPERGSANVRSDINYAIWADFRAHGVRIPFPQREVRMLGHPPAPGGPDAAKRQEGPKSVGENAVVPEKNDKGLPEVK